MSNLDPYQPALICFVGFVFPLFMYKVKTTRPLRSKLALLTLRLILWSGSLIFMFGGVLVVVKEQAVQLVAITDFIAILIVVMAICGVVGMVMGLFVNLQPREDSKNEASPESKQNSNKK